MIRVSADGADLVKTGTVQSLARHGDQPPTFADTEEAPHRMRAQAERPRTRQRGERQHFCRIRLAERLDVPLRARNTLLVSAGFAPVYPERPLSDPALTAAVTAIGHLLRAHMPFPAIAIDRHWTLVAANDAALKVRGKRFAQSSMFFLREEKTFANTDGTYVVQTIYRAQPNMTITAIAPDGSLSAVGTTAVPSPREVDFSRNGRFLYAVSPGNAATGVLSLNVVGAEEGDVDRHVADAREEAPLLAAEAEAGVGEQFAGDFGEAALAGDADAEVFCH